MRNKKCPKCRSLDISCVYDLYVCEDCETRWPVNAGRPKNKRSLSMPQREALIADIEASPDLCIDGELAEKYDLSLKHIARIRRNSTDIRFKRGRDKTVSQLLRKKLIKLVNPEKGLKIYELARKHNCSQSTLSWLRRKHYSCRQNPRPSDGYYPYRALLEKALEPYRQVAKKLSVKLDDVLEADMEQRKIEKVLASPFMQIGGLEHIQKREEI
ncbi:MAG: hypothetical protein JXB42_12760 [Deltaproteobacteria bacterium]|nr:hypothetical protein [Deltaproteobacteria bacterium]